MAEAARATNKGSVSSEAHPEYNEMFEHWEQLSDCYDGSHAVKDQREKYLPATTGMRLDGLTPGQKGHGVYEGYLKRAVFPEFVKNATHAMVGLMNSKPPKISLPEAMEPMRENATIHGETLEQLYRRTVVQQWVKGRVGYLVELPNGGGPNDLPYIATYEAETILNWDDGERSIGRRVLNLVMLDESGYERDGFDWVWKKRTRYLILGDMGNNESDGVYRFAVTEDGNRPVEGDFQIASHAAGGSLDQIPFVFINSRDLLSDPDKPPLLSLSNLDLTVYRGEADYRQALFEQAQDTLVVVGDSLGGNDPEDDGSPRRIGSGAAIELSEGGEAYFIGPDSQGLPEMRKAIENDRARADALSGRLRDNRSAQKESAEALKIRASAETATLYDVALTAAAGLQKALRIQAKWIGMSDAEVEEVVVEPNLEFTEAEDTPEKLVQLNRARKEGFPISKASLHRYAQERNYTEMSFLDEQELIEEEAPDLGSEGLGVLGDPPAGQMRSGSDAEGGEEEEQEEQEEEEQQASRRRGSRRRGER